VADPDANAINPLAIAQDIQHSSEQAVIASLKSNHAKWTRFVTGVASGDQAWVDLGLLLLPHAIGAARRDLRLAFEDALVAAPVTVVSSLSDRSPSLSVICGPSAHPEYDLSEDSINQRLSAVGTALAQRPRASQDPEQVTSRMNKCADALQAADEALRKGQPNRRGK
jgi:hypothetical protein